MTAQSGMVSVSGGSDCSVALAIPEPLTVELHDSPSTNPTINGTDTLCVNSTGTYTTEAGMANYLWTAPGGTIITPQGTNTISVNYITTGQKAVTVTTYNIYDCPSLIPGVFDVYVNPLPIPTVEGQSTACTNYPVTYTTQSNMTDYDWIISQGDTILSGQGTNSVLVEWGSAGNHWIKVNYTDINGCTSTDPTVFNVDVSLGAYPSIIGYNEVYVNSDYNLYTTDAGMTNYVWEISDSTLNIIQHIPTIDNMIYVTWNVLGEQWVRVNYTNDYGCTSFYPVQFDVTVSPAVGIENHNTSSVSLYPNPNNGHFTLTVASPSKETFIINIFNSLGMKIYESHDTVNGTLNKIIDLNSVSTGIYSVVLQNGNVHLEKKIIINR